MIDPLVRTDKILPKVCTRLFFWSPRRDRSTRHPVSVSKLRDRSIQTHRHIVIYLSVFSHQFCTFHGVSIGHPEWLIQNLQTNYSPLKSEMLWHVEGSTCTVLKSAEGE